MQEYIEFTKEVLSRYHPVSEASVISLVDHAEVKQFDKGDVLLKVGTIDSVELHAGHPTPVALTMRNEATGTRSRILLDSVLYDSDLDEGMFTVERLEEQGPPH